MELKNESAAVRVAFRDAANAATGEASTTNRATIPSTTRAPIGQDGASGDLVRPRAGLECDERCARAMDSTWYNL